MAERERLAVSHTMQRRRIASNGPEVTRVGMGCAPLGNLYSAVDDDTALAAVDAAWDGGIRYFDTAPLYGAGLSEERVGRALAPRPRDEFVISTKVGRLLRPGAAGVDEIFDVERGLHAEFDFSRDGTLRSLEASLDRLGLDRIDVVFVHDPDDHLDEAVAETIPALLELRDQGVIGAVGAGMNQCEALCRLVRETDLDVVLVAGRYSLLDRSAATELLPLCTEAGVAVVVGGVFNSGVLASDSVDRSDRDGARTPVRATFDYGPASDAVLSDVRRLRSLCERSGVALQVAAVQFPLRHPAVTSVVIGARTPDEVRLDLDWAASAVPAAMWDDLDA